MMATQDESRSRFPRRLLLAGSGAAAAAGVTDILASSPADAAAAGAAWKLGGNAGVDGSNFLGPTNVASLIFKTTPNTTSAPKERMRITQAGLVGIGVTTPAAALDVTTATAKPAIQGTTTHSSGTPYGIHGVSANGYGVYGDSTNEIGLGGTGGYAGIVASGGEFGGTFESTDDGTGVWSAGDTAYYASGGTYGVYAAAADDYGVYAFAQGGSTATGVYGYAGGTGVSGEGGTYGVHGYNASNAGVKGESTYVGVWGQATTWGVFGLPNDSADQTYGVYGQSAGSAGYGIYSNGNAHVSGTLSKTAGSFKIDHPLDPENKWLSHSFVESPDMMNVYNGNVVLDHSGEATIELPDYFAVLNRDFRYQLTTIGAAALVYVSSEISDRTFTIAGGKAGMKVSWQVTGIRHDAYAKEHPIVVVTEKSKAERGTLDFVPAGSSAKKMQLSPVASR